MENSHTPTLVSPDTKTPPMATKRKPTNGLGTKGVERVGSEPVDSTALTKALEDTGRARERTPGASPSRKRQRVYGDRSVTVAIHVFSRDCRKQEICCGRPCTYLEISLTLEGTFLRIFCYSSDQNRVNSLRT